MALKKIVISSLGNGNEIVKELRQEGFELITPDDALKHPGTFELLVVEDELKEILAILSAMESPKDPQHNFKQIVVVPHHGDFVTLTCKLPGPEVLILDFLPTGDGRDMEGASNLTHQALFEGRPPWSLSGILGWTNFPYHHKVAKLADTLRARGDLVHLKQDLRDENSIPAAQMRSDCESLRAIHKLRSEAQQQVIPLQFDPVSDDQITASIVGSSRGAKELRKHIAQIAATSYDVLIVGETGTGKELTAQAIHKASPRRDKPFVAINCAVRTVSFASELFGHVKGAFTGAVKDRQGHLKDADGGSVFLDEINSLSVEDQGQLLRVTQERRFSPVGSNKETSIDVRFIAATNADLKKEIAQGRFREDLYFRLDKGRISILPLRDRLDDIREIADYWVKNEKKAHLSEAAISQLKSYDWPGNVRELVGVLAKVSIQGEGMIATYIQEQRRTQGNKGGGLAPLYELFRRLPEQVSQSRWAPDTQTISGMMVNELPCLAQATQALWKYLGDSKDRASFYSLSKTKLKKDLGVSETKAPWLYICLLAIWAETTHLHAGPAENSEPAFTGFEGTQPEVYLKAFTALGMPDVPGFLDHWRKLAGKPNNPRYRKKLHELYHKATTASGPGHDGSEKSEEASLLQTLRGPLHCLHVLLKEAEKLESSSGGH